MKKFAQRFILLIAAATVFFTGAGVTIINYCCTSCSGQTLFMTEQHICCVQENDDIKAGSCCSEKEMSHDACESDSNFTKDTHCTASRLSIDIDASSFRPHVAIPFVWISDAFPVLSASIIPVKTEYAGDYTSFRSPPGIPPREYLSFIRILII
ncbi:hypothetical protein D0T84_07345 [Dysgonomonas sp. 521]|uniref:hypothetical protein n=1 Tax=Dysgonomonas sp. 521 TaxID=2302932 RepID=UPI0013D056E7|nr:hypothetical protein [Dysgonomonas sp. 521]NDV94733.1 hypothetical protein [Dysgonomonas sp. 521]